MSLLASLRARGRVDKITSLFLSATVRDMGDYRAKIPNWAQGLNINVNPQKYWSGAAEPIENLCKRRLSGCSGYIGLFGYRYGWRPPGRDKSITHIEFDHARSIWMDRSNFPPIFLFVPETGSEAERDLAKLADDVLAQEFGNDPFKMNESRISQERFRRDVASLGRLVNDFDSIWRLEQRITTSVYHYNDALLTELLAAQSLQARMLEIPSGQLGRIGRNLQIDSTKSLILALGSQTSVPGATMIAHGDETAGLAEFLDFLDDWSGWGHAARIMTLSPTNEDPAVLAEWIRRALGETDSAEGDRLDLLATGIARRCEREPIVVILKRPRGWRPERFQTEFWLPLFDRLQARWTSTGSRKKFILVRAFEGPKEPGQAQPIQVGEPSQPQHDWTRAFLLPRCDDLTEAHVASWLSDLGLDPGHAARVAREAVRRSDGTPDCEPLHVFARLRTDGFWEEVAAGI